MNLEEQFAYQALNILELDNEGQPSYESLELLLNFINQHAPQLIGHVLYYITSFPKFIEFANQKNTSVSSIQEKINNAIIKLHNQQSNIDLPTSISNLPKKVEQTATLDQPSSLETIKDLQTKILNLPAAELVYLAKQISPNIYNFERLPSGLHERSEVFTRQPDKLITEILKQPPHEKQTLIDIIKSLLKQIETETDRSTAQIHALIDNTPTEHHLATIERTPIPPILYESENPFSPSHPQTPTRPKKPHSQNDQTTKVFDNPFKPKK